MFDFAVKAKGKIGFYRNKVRYRYLDNFYFVHINKTGGTSIENALKIPFEHKTAQEKIKEVGLKNWQSRFTFGIVRNPWDRVVSQYFHRVKTRQTGLPDSGMDFHEWCERCFLLKDPQYRDTEKMFMPQVDWLRSGGGTLLVDFVGRFENLQEAFDHVVDETDIQAFLPHLKSTEREDYRNYYDEKTKEIVGEAFSEDIKAFGYRF